MFDPFFNAVTKLANTLIPHVIPLFSIPTGQRPALEGTALFVEQNDKLFLVSAKHVFMKDGSPKKLFYYEKTRSLRRVVGMLISTNSLPNVQSSDRYDVSVLQLPADTPRTLLEVAKFPAPHSSLKPFQSSRHRKHYLVTGFPTSRSRADPSSKQLKSKPQGYTVVSAEDDAYKKLGFGSDMHIVMNLDISSMNFPDGTTGRIPDPHGMSGSPIWLMYDDGGEDDPQSTPIVGIAIEYHKSEKLLVATDVGVALELMAVLAGNQSENRVVVSETPHG